MPINSDNSLAILAIKALNGGGGGGDVTSVFGRTGAVTAQNGDYNVTQVTGAAPLDSPQFTNNPTAPTQATSDSSTKLATTEFVQNNLTPINAAIAGLQVVTPVTVGATNAQYPDFTSAYSAGARNIECISDFTQATQFIFSESVYIKVNDGVNITINSALSNPIFFNGSNPTSLILTTEGTGAFRWAGGSGGGAALFSSLSNSKVNYYIKNCNVDFTGAAAGVYLVSSTTNCNELYFEGNIKITCRAGGASGMQFTTSTARSIKALNANLIFIGGGVNSNTVLSVSNTSFVSVNSIQLIGDFSTTGTLVALSSPNLFIGSILYNPTTAANGAFSLSGVVNNIVNAQNSQINVTIASNGTAINNASLGAGFIDCAFRNNVGLSNISAGNITNRTATTYLINVTLASPAGTYTTVVNNSPVNGNLIMSDSDGNGLNSGVAANNVQLLVGSATAGHIATLNSSGQVVDSGTPISTITPVSTKTFYCAPPPLGQSTNSGFTPQAPMDLQTMLNSLGSTGNLGVILPGTYTGTFTVSATTLNATIAGTDGGICYINGTLNINANGSSSNRFTGFAANTINLNGTAGVYFARNVTVNTALNKTSSCYLQVTDNSDLQGSSSSCVTTISAGGSVNFWANTKVGFVVISNASAFVSYQNVVIAAPITMSAGNLLMNNTIVFSSTGTGNAITTTGGTLQMQNVVCLNPSYQASRISIGASSNYAIISATFDVANSTLAGTDIGINAPQNTFSASANSAYSTSEINTGTRWLNGKYIYRKCYSLSNINGSSGYIIDAALTNTYISSLVRIVASGQTPSANGSVWFSSNLNDGGSVDWRILLDASGLQFLSNVGSVTTAQNLNVIVEYTK